MASLSTAAVLILVISTSLAFPQRPLASYNNQMTSPQPSYSPVGFYIVPMQSGGRMGSYGQYGSPYGIQQPHFVLVNPGNFAPNYNSAQNRMDVLAQEPPNVQPKPDSTKDAQQNDAETQSLSEADPQQSSVHNPQSGPMYIVLNQGPQMAYYDLMQQLGANYLPGNQPAERGVYGGGQHVNFVPFRPASRYRSHEPVRRRSQKPPVGLSYAYPNLFTRQQSYDEDSDDSDEGVVIEASQQRRAQQGERVDSEKVVAAEAAGPSVAQAKPQAIAMAGPGGVAAATPMATAVVGPGGMAVAAPSATAVAGPSGGKPPIALGGSTNAALTAAYKAQMKAERKQDQFSAVSLGGRLVAPLGTTQTDGKYASYGMY